MSLFSENVSLPFLFYRDFRTSDIVQTIVILSAFGWLQICNVQLCHGK